MSFDHSSDDTRLTDDEYKGMYASVDDFSESEVQRGRRVPEDELNQIYDEYVEDGWITSEDTVPESEFARGRIVTEDGHLVLESQQGNAHLGLMVPCKRCLESPKDINGLDRDCAFDKNVRGVFSPKNSNCGTMEVFRGEMDSKLIDSSMLFSDDVTSYTMNVDDEWIRRAIQNECGDTTIVGNFLHLAWYKNRSCTSSAVLTGDFNDDETPYLPLNKVQASIIADYIVSRDTLRHFPKPNLNYIPRKNERM